jgi:H+/Cl- antiporter ClcA
VDVPGVLLARTLLVKIVGCICSVAAGLAVGKEGPFVHIGENLSPARSHPPERLQGGL